MDNTKNFKITHAGEAGSLIGGSAPQSASTGKGK